MSTGTVKNIYIPVTARVEKITEETHDTRTVRLALEDSADFIFKPGQFVELSVFGAGESPFCIASSPSDKGFIECSVKRFGLLTQAVHELEENDTVGIRGPYGNGFPVEYMFEKNIVFVAGGIGLAALKSLILYTFENRNKFNEITVIYGARSTKDIVYKEELEKWSSIGGVKLILTVDPGGETPLWKGKIGLVPKILEEINPSSQNSLLITCGPPIMIKFVLKSAEKLNFKPEQVITTLERKMQCGFGKCGHCMIGHKYVCKDGPVFTYAQIKELGEEI